MRTIYCLIFSIFLVLITGTLFAEHINMADTPRLFIIDDDVGMMKKAVRGRGPYQAPWLPITDPDGGLEVIYALREPGVKVLGITCAMGCSSTDVCVESVNKMLEL